MEDLVLVRKVFRERSKRDVIERGGNNELPGLTAVLLTSVRKVFRERSKRDVVERGGNNDLPGLNAVLLLEGVIVVAHKACHNASAVPGVLLGRPQELQPWPQHLEEVLRKAREGLED